MTSGLEVNETSLIELHQIAGNFLKEIETTRTALTKEWLGEEIADVMAKGGKFFEDMGGYTLPKARPQP